LSRKKETGFPLHAKVWSPQPEEMMAVTDRAIVNVLDDISPTISAPDTYSVYEARAASVEITVNTGRPVANVLSAAIYGSRADAVSETDPIGSIALTLDGTLPTSVDTAATINVEFTAPEVTTADRRDAYFLRVNIAVTNQGARNASAYDITEVLVLNSVAATISAPSLYNVYSEIDVNLSFTFNPGSPTASLINVSWHSTLAAAQSGANPLTAGTEGAPVSSLTHTAFTDLATEATISDETGTIDFTTPTLTAATTLYGRLEIEQNGVVVASDAFSVVVAVRRSPSISLPNIIGIEGAALTETFTYESGAPFADAFHYSFYQTLQDAIDKTNPITNSGIISISISPASPVSESGSLTATLALTLPYVAQNRTLYIRIEIHQGSRVWYDTASILIQNRFQSSITMPDRVDIPETESVDSVGSYTVGIPHATAFDYEVYATETDRDHQMNELTGADQPLTIVLNPATPDVTGSRSESKTLTATITAPSVESDMTYYLLWHIIQAVIPEDP